jgi:hypothetical protein
VPTPPNGYRLADGTRVPSVTTIIGRFKDHGALMHWAFRQGKEGKARLYEETDKAADIGTVAHAMVEAHIRGVDFDRAAYALPAADWPKAESAFTAYRRWAQQVKAKIVEAEIGLVSERHHYGGTPDAVGLIGNELVLFDWKTAGAVYTDHLVQLAAYKALWEENRPGQELAGGCHLLRLTKAHGDFAHHHYRDLEDAWRSFLLMRELYDLDLALKRRAA